MLIMQSNKRRGNKIAKILVFRFCDTLQKQKKKIYCGTRLQAGQVRNCCVIPGTVKAVFQRVQTSCGVQKAFCSVSTRVFFQGVHLWGCEAEHSPAYSDTVKNEWSCTSTSPMPSWQAQGQLYCYLQFTTRTTLVIYR